MVAIPLGLRTAICSLKVSRSVLGKRAIDGESPVDENASEWAGIQSTTGHEESPWEDRGTTP